MKRVTPKPKPRRRTECRPPARAHRPRPVLVLFVAGMSTRSLAAIRSIKRICHEQLEGNCELAIVDLYRNPRRARAEQIVAAPTLIKKFPLPLRRLIGDLRDESRVLLGLELKNHHEPPGR